MRKIEQQLFLAIRTGKNWKSGNTSVAHESDGLFSVRLHGNEIARGTPKAVRLFDCGWQTVTTKSRMNAVLRAIDSPSRVYQTRGDWFLSTGDGERDFQEGICAYAS